MKKRSILLFIVLCVAWMGFIFFNSSQVGEESNTRSIGIVESIIGKNTVDNIQKEKSKNQEIKDNSSESTSESTSNNKNKSESKNESKNEGNEEQRKNNLIATKIKASIDFNYIVRKSAHAFEFGVLAILSSIVLTKLGVNYKKVIIFSLLFVLLYASMDEFHQLFVEGRSARVKDVMFDFAGGILGVFLFSICNNLKRIYLRYV